MKKVLIPTKLDKIAVELLRKKGYTVVQDDDSARMGALVREHPDTYAMIVRSEPVKADTIDALPQLKVVIRAGAGYNTIDIKYARKRGVDVMNTPGANANAVAEEVVALMLADARHVVKADSSCRAGNWEKTAFMGREISGKTVGIVGMGNIGCLVAKRLSGFECRLLGYDPMISRERAADFDVTLTDLETIFRESDIVTLHVPENDETRNMVNAARLSLMKNGATLINCARSGIVDEAALRIVKAEKGLHFLNDVYVKDEAGAKSVADIADIMLPHLGASTKEANATAARRAAEQLVDFDDKGITAYVVNRDIPEGLDPAYGNLAYSLARVCRAMLGAGTRLQRIETSCYGSLQPFADWLIVPMVSALWEEFDRSMDAKAAVRFLGERGIEYRNRMTDPHKRFASSITVDLTAAMDAENLKQASVRGTVAEGTPMVARINDFDRLYFEPHGHTVLFQYPDRPGVVAQISAALAVSQINIEDIRHSHNPKNDQSMCLMRVNKPVSEEIVRRVSAEIGACIAAAVTL
ncbi:MAG: 3-phosphoglycerate dehydrogenase family protein [bacterium]